MNPVKKLVSVIRTPEVEFLCTEDDAGVIPEPYPARKFMPDWFKTLEPKIDKQDKFLNSTIKRCAPFVDAMSIGWIIPLAADVEIISNDDASEVSYKWMYHKTMIEGHSHKQIEGHPAIPKPSLKFLNYWFIKMPKGYSALFVPPLNRKDPKFECVSGVVDDTYMGNGALEYVNFPFFFSIPKWTGIIKAGTPMVQMIPIKRDKVLQGSRRAIIKTASTADKALVEKTRARRRSHESLYRDKLWERK